jgi:hypothetical protein
MSSTDPRFPRPPFLGQELERLGRASFAAWADLCQRWGDVGHRHAARAGEAALAAANRLPEPADALHGLAAGARDYWLEMAHASGSALVSLGTALAPPGARDLPASHVVDGKPVLLPARIRDASQAMALWAVPTAAAGAALNARLGEAAEQFRLLDLGDDHSPFALFVVDYRESDLGAYHELGAAFFVRPAGDPGATPGMLMVDLPVDQAFTCAAGQTIWGYPKTLEHIELRYAPDRLHCVLRRRRARREQPALAISFPRGGEGVSSEMPLATYTVRDGAPCLTVFTRSGRGEATQACSAGAVILELGSAGDPLVDMLRGLGLPATPMLRGWTERMSGHFGIPRRLASG